MGSAAEAATSRQLRGGRVLVVVSAEEELGNACNVEKGIMVVAAFGMGGQTQHDQCADACVVLGYGAQQA